MENEVLQGQQGQQVHLAQEEKQAALVILDHQGRGGPLARGENLGQMGPRDQEESQGQQEHLERGDPLAQLDQGVRFLSAAL